ncbi:TetR/AcrR family transcriptional regulator [Celeribacter sp.]|uniref:TetR/AcrR family transcriptional regulator n=1 Tax=Celeribacter sp. TaxID=1890673 RepID=UPI003A8DBFAD
MSETAPKAKRGRPRTITRERIAKAGMDIGLPDLTFVGVATAIGVTQMALYKHVRNIDELRTLVAEDSFMNWELPDPFEDQDIESYLKRFAVSMWQLVRTHPGIAPYLLRRSWITDTMLEKTYAHQRRVAERFGLRFVQANTLVFSVAFHCCAVADASFEETTMSDEIEPLHSFGVSALIAGALAMTDKDM